MSTTINKFNYAQSLFSEKRYNEAAAAFKNIKKHYKDDANYWFILGICYANLAQYDNAEKHFRRATRLSPGVEQAWTNLGLTQLHQKKYDDAIKSFNQSITINPQFIDAICNLSLAYLYNNNIPKAESACRQAINLKPNNAQAHNIFGLCYQKSNKTKAIESFNQSITLNPGLFDAYHNLVDTYILYDDYDNAEQTIISTITKFNSQVSLHIKLGNIYENKKLLDSAISAYSQGLNIQHDNIDILTSIGRIHILKSDFDNGLSYIDKALMINSSHQGAVFEKSTYYILMREYNSAHELLEKLITNAGNSIQPRILIAYANACRLAGITENGIKPLQKLKNSSLRPAVLAAVHYTLGDIYDDIGEYDNAFINYKHANNIKYSDTDINYYRDVFSSIKKNLDRSTLNSLPHSANNTEKPIFIVGMPRSGTTLIEQILSSHPDIYGAGEITNLWSIGNSISGAMNLINYTDNLLSISSEEINRYSNQYIDDTKILSDNAKRCTDKLPHNFFHIGLIELLFPNSTIIHCTRNPFDNCLSIYFKDFNDNHKYARKLDDLALFYKEYMMLMEHWSNNSSLTIHQVQYESLVNNPDEKIRSLIEATGLEWNDACLEHHNSRRTIMTPSHDQASRPIYTNSVSRWKHYAHHIQPLVNIFGEPEQYIPQA